MTVTKTVVNGREVYEFNDASPEVVSKLFEAILENNVQPTVREDAPYYLDKMCDELNLSANDFTTMCRNVNHLSAGALQSMFLRTIAREFDLKYASHISEIPSVVVYSYTDGKLHEISQNVIKDKAYKYFAAFRNREDAIKALRIVADMKKAVLS